MNLACADSVLSIKEDLESALVNLERIEIWRHETKKNIAAVKKDPE